MADYFCPTVVQPSLPVADVTPLERLILDPVFEAATEGDRIFCSSSEGPGGAVTVDLDELRAAWRESQDRVESGISEHVAELLARVDSEVSVKVPEEVDIDLTEPAASWDRMFQDIVRRSATIDEIEVTTSFTCSKMRPEGFDGSAMLITADAIRYKSTTDIFEEFWNEADKARNASASPSVSA